MALSSLAAVLVSQAAARAETWKDVPIVDTLCLSKVKADSR
jgi:hypothetical protein